MPFSIFALPPRHLLALGSTLLTLLAVTGCFNPPAEETEVSIAEALAFEPIGWGLQARLDTTEIVIRDSTTWVTYQDSLRPLRPFRKINFQQEMVLLAALPVPTGGYSIRFQVVEKHADSLAARYLVSIPDDDCLTTMGASVVFQAVRMAKMDNPLSFVREQEADRCTDPR